MFKILESWQLAKGSWQLEICKEELANGKGQLAIILKLSC